MNNKKLLVIWSCVVVAVCVVFVVVSNRNASRAAEVEWTQRQITANSAPLPPGNIAPPPEFLNDYREYQQLQKEVVALLADKKIVRKQHELSGMIADLNRRIPQGYGWDEATMSFKPVQAPASPPPAPKK